MDETPLPLIAGIPGPELDPATAAALTEVHPLGVILFARNVRSPGQVRELAAALEELEPAPLVAVDLEGGAVNRLAGLWGTLPSPARAAASGRRAVRALGEAAGAACRALGIHLDLAPVVDLAHERGLLARQGRCLGDEPERVATLAGVFLDGLEAWGVGGCLKHFPGLGPVPEDTHEVLPELAGDAARIAPHLEPFERLAVRVRAVMVAHVRVPGLGSGELPATLDREVAMRAAALPGGPVVLSDDLDMGALEGVGSLPERAARALGAGCHGLLVCRSLDALPEVAARLRAEAEARPGSRARLEEAVARLDTLRRELRDAAAALPAPDPEAVAQLWERARREAEP